jgi:ketosteroid isomerase-like protein
MPPSNLDLARAYLQAIERRDPAMSDAFAPDVVQREFPNRLVPAGATRDLDALREGSLRGQQVLQREHYEIVNALEQGSEVALEVIWTGVLAIPIGTLAAGDTMRAHFGVFLTFRDGLIVSQRNYDCFDPF